ncbi:Hypothetical protein NGAL_HAMBI2605_58090 [Neorhizobium galegae bv. orientalis]|uniref:hypothetical protein n=1 Tax=Rhizobium leguminosarum TaxID=384 RepID=UPI000621B45D|nr:Hypothetical protein NGAL_HAMBI2605_58090 [Neorhizobium galegae bv. orientalis]
MRVFLLGAGASKSYAQSPTKQRMPIAIDFFQTFDKLAAAANPWVLQEGLYGYLFKKGIRNPHDYLRAGVDIEALHSEIEEARNFASLNAESFVDYMIENKAYVELIFIFASVINEIQNGPVSNPHRTIAKHLNQNDAVLTFNWDTLMDRALAEKTDWKPDFGYGVTPHKIFRNGWSEPTVERRPAPQLIKLHGSTNWITAYPTNSADGKIVLSHEADPSTLHVFEFADEPYACHAGRFMPGYCPYSYGYYPPNLFHVPGRQAPEGYMFLRARPKVPWREEGTAASDGLTSMPLIIPPVKKKSYELFGALFANLWSDAENQLVQADEIVIIGYSFPRTDLQSNSLFLNAFLRRTTVPRIIIIDPAPEKIAEKFRLEFGVPEAKIAVVKDYFSEDFDLAKHLGAS